MLLSSLLILTWAEPARAQQYVCGGGPGPGERMVGMSNGNHGAPLCVRDESASPRSEPEPPTWRPIPTATIHDRYFAVAWSETSPGGWLAAHYESLSEAQADALNACNQAKGGGCTLAISNFSSGLAFARDQSGVVHISTGGHHDASWDAEEAVERECRQRTQAPCQVFDSYTIPAWSEGRRSWPPEIIAVRW